MAVVRNQAPKLAVEPTIVVPPDIKLPQPNVPDLGNPLSHLPSVPSNGTGSGGGIGSGSGGGVGSGEGPDTAPVTAAAPVVGVQGWRRCSAPKVIYQPDPEYSEEARRPSFKAPACFG